MLSSYALFIGNEKDKSDSEITVNPQLKELVQNQNQGYGRG